MIILRWIQRTFLAVGLLFSVLPLCSPALGDRYAVDDIAPFGLIDVDSSFTIRYLLDDQERGSTSSGDTYETRATLEEEFFLMTRSFVYHPGFLNMEVGGGPLFVQQRFDSDVGDNRNKEGLFNFLGRLNFLDIKNYPFSLFYRRSHPSVTTSLSGRFLTENNEYGFSGRLDNLWSSASISADFSHRDSEGSGFETVVDDEIDMAALRLSTSYWGGDRIEITHNKSETDSSSGSLGLPIQESQIDVDDTVVRLSNWFGSNNQFHVIQGLRRFKQERLSDTFTESEDRNYNLAMRWEFSDATQTQIRYDWNDFKRIGSDSAAQKLAWSVVSRMSDEFNYDAGVDSASEEQVGFSRDQIGARAALNYTRDFDFGSVGVAGSVRKDRTNQISDEDTIQVFDEPIALNGTVPSALRNDFVLQSSVVVSNSSQTQTYVEGLDYRLVIVGSITEIQRLIDGNISDGEIVLVDYQYLTGGTTEFDALTSNIGFTVGFLRHLSAFARFNRRATDIRSGEPNFPLNDLQSIDVGFSFNYPLPIGWMVDGQVRRVDQDEEISPFVRDTVDVNFVGRLKGNLQIRLNGNLVKADIENSSEDVDQIGYGLGVGGRLWRHVKFDAFSRYLHDTGGTLERKRLEHGLNLQWLYRQVRFDLRARLSDETLGDTQRQYLQMTAQITRLF